MKKSVIEFICLSIKKITYQKVTIKLNIPINEKSEKKGCSEVK